MNNDTENFLDLIASEILRNTIGDHILRSIPSPQLWACERFQLPKLETQQEFEDFIKNDDNKRRCAVFKNPNKTAHYDLWEMAFHARYEGPIYVPAESFQKK
jgi:hypothetical protein